MRSRSALLITLSALLGACASPAGLAPRLQATEPAALATARSLGIPGPDWPVASW